MNNEKLYLEIVNNMRDGVYFVDKERKITLWNKAAEDISGYKKEDVVGKPCQETPLKHIDEKGGAVCVLGCPLFKTIDDGQQRKHAVFLKHKDGYRVPVSVNIFPLKEDGEIVGAIEIFTRNSPTVYDDTLIENLSDFAMKDQLTGLSNRRRAESFLEFKLREMRVFQNMFCVVFLDIDNFRSFNNTYGHDAGDEVLKSVAKSAMYTIRANDLFGRWGGEEFIGIFTVQNAEGAATIGEKIRALIEKTEIQYKDTTLSITASIGVTTARSDDTIDSVIKRADLLMYHSKKNGKNRVTAD